MARESPEMADSESIIHTDPLISAEAAGLRYIDDEETKGVTRQRRGRGFAYYHPNGTLVEDAGLKARFQSLAIPPAWKEVWISPDSDSHILATGRDEKNRKQYIYHPAWSEIRSQTKFNRMIHFGELLPGIREQVDQDLQRRNLSREKVMAIVIRLLEETLIRIGNPEYARKNNSFGLTTLRNKHLEIAGSQLRFTFRGKKGKQMEVSIQNRRIARMVRCCQELPGQELFQYYGENGECCQVITSSDVNAYLKEITREDITAKDFRTWGATVQAAIELDQIEPSESEKENQRKVVQVVKSVASRLGNTPTICRNYYIHPAIIQAFLDGSLSSIMDQQIKDEEDQEEHRNGLSPEERGVLAVLRQRISVA